MAGVAAPLQWVAVDVVSGAVIDYLPNLIVTSGSLAVTIGRYETATVQLPLDNPPPAWQAVCGEYTSALIALDADENPLWGGIVDQASESVSATDPDAVDLRLVTAEGYFDRRYLADRAFAATGQNAIAANLIASFVVNGPGLPARIVGGAGGVARDRGYLDTDDKTVYSALQDLMSDEGGVEFAVGWEWQHAPERITPVVYLGGTADGTIGTAPAPGQRPNATFDLPGCVQSVKRVRDFASGRGASKVRAYGATAGTGRLFADSTASNLLGRPLVEYRFTPSTTITDTATLKRHAAQAQSALNDGSQSLTLAAAVASAPRFGVDWFLGDTIGYDLHAPAWPNGLTGTARCIGVQLDPAGVTVSPVLAGSL